MTDEEKKKRKEEKKYLKTWRQPTISSDGKYAVFTDGTQYSLRVNEEGKAAGVRKEKNE